MNLNESIYPNRRNFAALLDGLKSVNRIGWDVQKNEFSTAPSYGFFFFHWQKPHPNIKTELDTLIPKIEEFIHNNHISEGSLNRLNAAVDQRVKSLKSRLTGFWSIFMFSATKAKIRDSITKLESVRNLTAKPLEAFKPPTLSPIEEFIPEEILLKIFYYCPQTTTLLSKNFSKKIKAIDFVNQNKIPLIKLDLEDTLQANFMSPQEALNFVTSEGFNFIQKHGKDLQYLNLIGFPYDAEPKLIEDYLNEILECCPNLLTLETYAPQNFILQDSNRNHPLQNLKLTSRRIFPLKDVDILSFKSLPDLRNLSIDGLLNIQISTINTLIESWPSTFNELHLKHNVFQQSEPLFFSKPLPLSKHIKCLTLDVSYVGETEFPLSLFDNLAGLSKLTLTLKLSIHKFSKILSKLPNLEHLYFNLYSFGKMDSIEHLPSLLAPLINLKSLDLTAFGSIPVQIIHDVIHVLPNLKKFKVNLPEIYTDNDLITLTSSIQQLQILEIKGIGLVPKYLKELQKEVKPILIFSFMEIWC